MQKVECERIQSVADEMVAAVQRELDLERAAKVRARARASVWACPVALELSHFSFAVCLLKCTRHLLPCTVVISHSDIGMLKRRRVSSSICSSHLRRERAPATLARRC